MNRKTVYEKKNGEDGRQPATRVERIFYNGYNDVDRTLVTASRPTDCRWSRPRLPR